MINKDTIVLLNKSDVQYKQNHKFDVETVLASVKENKNIDILIKKIKVLSRIDTKNELEYYKNGGILQYVLRNDIYIYNHIYMFTGGIYIILF